MGHFVNKGAFVAGFFIPYQKIESLGREAACAFHSSTSLGDWAEMLPSCCNNNTLVKNVHVTDLF